MKIALLTSILALIGVSCAAPTLSGDSCMSFEERTQWLETFIGVLGKTDPHYQSTANKILADNFVEYSNSRQSIQGLPVRNPPAVSEPSKKVWIDAIIQDPQIKGIVTYEHMVSCFRILWYWAFTGLGTAEYPIVGFNLFRMNRTACGRLQFVALYPEFDTIAYGLDTGIKVQCPNEDGFAIILRGEMASCEPMKGRLLLRQTFTCQCCKKTCLVNETL